MATAKKTAVKKAVKAAPTKPAPHVRISQEPKEVKPATLDDLIEGAKETIKISMKEPHFAAVTYNDHAKAARMSLIDTVSMGFIETTLRGKALENYITAALEIKS